MIGRIVKSLSGFYEVQTEAGVVTCRARGHFRKEGLTPLTGDLAEISCTGSRGMVEEILPRKNHFLRPAVANLDALVVFAANVNPVTEPFLIDRVAAIAGNQEVPVILCLNKTDLDPAEDLGRIYERAGFPVLRTSAETGAGVEALRAALAGKLTAFTGNSGVGKSSVFEPPGAAPGAADRGGFGKAGPGTAYHPACGALRPGWEHLCGGYPGILLL